MVFDIIILLSILLAALQGYRKGFLRQAFVFFGIVLAFFYTKPLSAYLAERFFVGYDTFYNTRSYIAFITIVAVLIVILSALLGAILQKTLIKGIVFADSTNKALGASLGIVVASIILFFIVCLFDVFKAPITHSSPLFDGLYSSRSMQICEKYNPIPYLADDYMNSEQGKKLSQLLKTINISQRMEEDKNPTLHPESNEHYTNISKPENHGENTIQSSSKRLITEKQDLALYQELLRHKDFQELVHDPMVYEALSKKNHLQLTLDPRVLRLANNKEFIETAKQFPWEKYYKQL
ncbi:MAG: CvpA family protein [Bradymonadales bacterium]|jgi:uncharacterized membrane protein required for colicin V production